MSANYSGSTLTLALGPKLLAVVEEMRFELQKNFVTD
jgi:hypothetical protein